MSISCERDPSFQESPWNNLFSSYPRMALYTHAFDKNKKAASQVLQEGLEI